MRRWLAITTLCGEYWWWDTGEPAGLHSDASGRTCSSRGAAGGLRLCEYRELVGMQPGDVPVTYADSSALEVYHVFGQGICNGKEKPLQGLEGTLRFHGVYTGSSIGW